MKTVRFTQISWSHRMCQPEVLWLDRDWINLRAVWAQHCTLGLRGDFHLLQMQSQREVTEKQSTLSRAIGRLVIVQIWVCSRALRVVLGDVSHTGREILKVKLKEISIIPAMEAGAALGTGNCWQNFSITRHPGVELHTWILPHCRRALHNCSFSVSTPPLLHPMLSQLSTQRNHSVWHREGSQNPLTLFGWASEMPTIYSGAGCGYLCAGVLCVWSAPHLRVWKGRLNTARSPHASSASLPPVMAMGFVLNKHTRWVLQDVWTFA